MNFNLFHILHWSYWVQQPLIARGAAAIGIWSFMGALLAVGVVAAILYITVKKTEFKKVYYILATTGIAGGLYGLAWMFMRQERIQLWSWRLWLVPLAVFLIYRGYRLYTFCTRRLPEIKKFRLEQERKREYLPGSR